jgi:MFS family permease
MLTTQPGAITQWLQKTNRFTFACYVSVAAFCLYVCIFALRKTFGVGLYDTQQFAGIGLKSWMVIAQLLGYMLSKFLGIKFVSEADYKSRSKHILILVSIAAFSWLGFAITPAPYSLVFLFFNGLPLGMVWGLVFSYLEGRRLTEVLGASLSVSFIFSAGFAKSTGSWLMTFGVSELWMPFIAALVFFPPLLVFLFLLNQIPPPSTEDEALRTKRKPMNKQERIQFILIFWPGLISLIIAYTLLTAFRDFRDNFSADVWVTLGFGGKPALFTATEIPITLCVLVLIASLMAIKNNHTAMIVNHVIVLVGFVIVGLTTYLYDEGFISTFEWMLWIGMGLYFGYIQFNSIFFDRLIANFKYESNVGFLIYLADSVGYLGSVTVVVYKELGQSNTNVVDFFKLGGYCIALAGTTCISISLYYFIRKKVKWMSHKHSNQKSSSIF